LGRLKKREDEAKTKSMLANRTVVNKPEPQKPATMSNIARKINLGTGEFGREDMIEEAILFLILVPNFNGGIQISLKRLKWSTMGCLNMPVKAKK